MGGLRFQFYTISATLLLLLSACGPAPRQRVAATLTDVESYINDRPDSALAVLEGMDSTVLTTRALRAKFSLLHTMALDKCYNDITDPDLLEAAVFWYVRHGSPDDKMKTCYYQGRAFQDSDNLNKAAIAYAEAERYAVKATDEHAKALLYFAFGSLYNRVFNAQQELKYKDKGLQILKEEGDSLYDIALGELALVYHSMERWELADSLYQEAIIHAEQNSIAMRTFLSNYARMLLLQPEPDPSKCIKLLKRLQTDYKVPLSIKDAGVYAYASELLGETDTVNNIIKQWSSLPDEKQADVLPWLSRIAVHRGDYRAAYHYQNLAVIHERDDIESSLSDPVTQALQEHFDAVASQERKAKLQLLWVSMPAMLILIIIVLLMIIRKLTIETERDKLLQAYKTLVQEMTTLESRFESLSSDYLRTNNELNQEKSKNEHLLAKAINQEDRVMSISQKLQDVQERFQRERLSRFRQMGRLGSTVWQRDNRRIEEELAWKELKDQLGYIHQIQHGGKELVLRLDKELDGAITRMRNDLGLKGKPKEVLFLCCCVLDMDPVFISDIFDISIDNVYKKKSRYRAKVEALGCVEYILLLHK